MAWQPVDVARSIQLYLSKMLVGPPWTIRTRREEVADDQRPVAVISLGAAQILRARETVEQGEVELVVPITVSAYPELKPSVKEAWHDAEVLRGHLFNWISSGLRVQTDGELDGRHWAGPFRLPLWDFAAVPLEGTGKVPTANPHDVLWAEQESLSVEPIQDPDDPARFSVILNTRVTIERPGRVHYQDDLSNIGPPVQEWLGEWIGHPNQ